MKCRIKNITELDGITQKVSHIHRIGREGNLFFMKVKSPMCLRYIDGHGTLITSIIDDVDETPRGFKIKTQSAIYILEKI